jgi:hypothetical protein
MNNISAVLLLLGFFLLMLIQLRTHIRGFTICGSLLHDILLEKLDSTDNILAILGLCLVIIGLVLFCISL